MKRPITYGEEYRRYRNIVTRTIKASKNEYYRDKFNQYKGNSKKTWKQLNKILGKSTSTQSNVFKINDKLVDDPNVIANKFNDYYSNIASSVANNMPDSNVAYNEFLVPVNVDRINWEPATVIEVKEIVKKLNNVKEGPDKIPISIIKNNIDTLSPILTHLCNLSLSSGVFPRIHKLGILNPLHKK